MFVAIEGTDASGKHTQTKLLHEYLSRFGECIKTEEPTTGPIGKFIVEILNTKEHFDQMSLQILFTADRAWEVDTIINPALKAGKSIAADRYRMTTVAYGMASGLKKDWLMSLQGEFPEPDFSFILDIPRETIEERLTNRSKAENRKLDMHERKVDFLVGARNGYLEIAKYYKNAFVIDGTKSIDRVHEEIVKIIEKNRTKRRVKSGT